jgi:DcaP outer membrane protein
MKGTAVLALCLMASSASLARAQAPQDAKPSIEIYGFGQADAIADFNQNNPDWYDVVRPSRLPNVANQFGEDGHFYLSPRQSRFGTKATLPTSDGDVSAQFEFDMFGTGKDAGLTTIRLRHAWGQWKQIGGGQTNSQFMDVDVFPNTIEYWGPNGMLFLRNAQIFYEVYKNGDSNARVAIEAPGASGDAGQFADRVELQNVRGRFPSPDFTGHYRHADKWGYVQVGGALRYIAYDDLIPDDQFNLSGHVWGWGLSLSSNIKATPDDVLRLQLIEGAGIENYFNDAPIDVGLKRNPGNAVTPLIGEALGDFGLVVYLDHTWNDRFTSAVGYSRVDISNSDAQSANAYKTGQYASGNLLYTPTKNVMMGGEFLWGHRENFSDGFTVSDTRIQFSVKYSFGMKVGG